MPQRYSVYIAKSGDISRGASSTGAVLRELGNVEMRKNDNYGDLFAEVKDLNIWEIIGRASESPSATPAYRMLTDGKWSLRPYRHKLATKQEP